MTPKIVVVGSANTDFVRTMSELPPQEGPVLGDQYCVVREGNRANIACIGTDGFEEAPAVHRDEDLCTDFIVQDPETHSGIALMVVNRNGENMIVVSRGVEPSLPSKQELDQFMVSSATGSNPAILDAVDLSTQAETSL
jgi:sugar/nucleoside kinase (ribokinase family)